MEEGYMRVGLLIVLVYCHSSQHQASVLLLASLTSLFTSTLILLQLIHSLKCSQKEPLQNIKSLPSLPKNSSIAFRLVPRMHMMIQWFSHFFILQLLLLPPLPELQSLCLLNLQIHHQNPCLKIFALAVPCAWKQSCNSISFCLILNFPRLSSKVTSSTVFPDHLYYLG